MYETVSVKVEPMVMFRGLSGHQKDSLDSVECFRKAIGKKSSKRGWRKRLEKPVLADMSIYSPRQGAKAQYPSVHVHQISTDPKT